MSSLTITVKPGSAIHRKIAEMLTSGKCPNCHAKVSDPKSMTVCIAAVAAPRSFAHEMALGNRIVEPVAELVSVDPPVVHCERCRPKDRR